MSDSPAMESPRRRLTAKQADTIQRLSAATMAVLNREGCDGLTIRLVAAEAGIGAATAYTYFSSKEHLVAEVFWRRLASTPTPATSASAPPVDRVTAVLRHVTLLLVDETEFARAVTNALLGRDPDLQHLRDRIGREIRDRLVDASGPDTAPAIIDALELLYAGALVVAGMGYASYAEVADRLEESTRRMFGETQPSC